MSVNQIELNFKLISELSKLSCTGKIKHQDIAEIIDYLNTIRGVESNADNIIAEADMPCRLREDNVELKYSRADMLRNASHKTNKYICVPKTVD